ncbi:MAG: Acetolactate synthase [Chloroflexi bacterium]|nr:Acetolactate synthase [Chloroflexota bacterium]
MIETRQAGVDERWGSYEADEWSDAVVQSMKLGGVDRLYFVSGSEIGFYQESIVRAHDRGWQAPRLITMIHESTALNAALGDIMVSGQPAATAAHVDVGTLNYGAAINTAWEGQYPVLITAGTGPRAYTGSMPGSRDNSVQWIQEPRDQGGIIRQYTKVDHRMEHQDNPGLIVSRLLQIAMSESKGPAYLAIPRETAMARLPGTTRFPTRDELGVARPVRPEPEDARKVAEWLIGASNPCFYTAQGGRNPESVAELVRLAELLGVPVMDTSRVCRLNFPTTHPLFGTGPSPSNADAIVVFESPGPFMPPNDTPRPGTRVVVVDSDPVQSRHKTLDFQADLWLPTATAEAARAIYEAATSMLSKSDMDRIADRRARLEDRKREMLATAETAAERAGQRRQLHPRWVAYQLGKLLEPDAILLDDSLSNAGFVRAHHARSQAGTYFQSASSAGGWGTGAAFGAKLAAPERDVVLASGDGYFVFGTPLAAIWAAAHHKAPFLSVVFVNRSYTTGTSALERTYPEGNVARSGNYEGGLFDPPPDFAKEAEAGNGYGETVREPEEVEPALRRAMQHVRNGTPAVIAAWLPTLVEEMKLR